MKVIRQICYEGSEEWLREQLSRSMPEGVRPLPKGTIEVRTVYSELPELEPFVPVVGGYMSIADAQELAVAMAKEDV